MFIKILILIVIGAAGGLIGGMGMGGGTLLIPLLTMFTETPQHIAQAVNLIAFVPMSAVALFIHTKNKLVNYKLVPLMAIPAVITGVLSAMLAKNIEANRLKLYFGIFLVLLSIYQLTCMLLTLIRKKRETARAAAAAKAEEQRETTVYFTKE